MSRIAFTLLTFACAVFVVTTVGAATPPDSTNFQGVLRDASDAPLDGPYDMTFRLFDADAGGNEILVDQHLAAGAGAVDVAGGLFNVALGAGAKFDGSGPGTYTTLAAAFRDHANVWLQIEVAGEVLSPRVRVRSSPYAHNSTHLDGRPQSEFINTGASNQTKTGNLTVNDLIVNGEDVWGVGGARLALGDERISLSNNSDTGDLILIGGQTSAQGSIQIVPTNQITFRAGTNGFSFQHGPTGDEVFRIDLVGNLVSDGNLTTGGDVRVNGNQIFFASPAAKIENSATYMWMVAGDADTDDIYLYAGNSSDDGELFIGGDSLMRLRAGNGNFSFVNGTNGAEILDIAPNGNLTVEDGSQIFVEGSAAEHTFAGANLTLNLGDSGADQVLVPGSLTVTGAKNFVQNHPFRDDLSVVYTALEGDESGTYTRGSARLSDGVARVALGQTFAWTTNPDVGLTVQLTARGTGAVLYVESVSTTELVVRTEDPRAFDATFDYMVMGLRLGYESFDVIQPRITDAPVPSETFWAERYAGREEHRRYSARERFDAMEAGVFRSTFLSDGAGALRRSIGERHRARDAEPEGAEPLAPEDGPVASSISGPATGSAPRVSPAPEDLSAQGSSTSASGGFTVPMDDDGNVYARSFRPSAGDLANLVPVGEPVEAGDVLAIDAHGNGSMRLATQAGDAAVFGVVAAEPGLILGSLPPQDGVDEGRVEVPVAVSGIVTVKVDAGYGSILPGDLLVTSPTPGHAMRSDDPRPGTILGKALEPLDVGAGTIRVLVTLR